MKTKWLERSKGVRRILIVFYALLLILFLMDIFIHKHTELFFEKLYFFFPLYGFFSCLVIFGVTKGVTKIIKRGVDYYER